MPASAENIEQLRSDVQAATRGLSEGQHALVDALSELQLEKNRAAEGYRAVVQSLAAALEARDGYTSEHSDEVRLLAVAVAERLGLDERALAEVQAVADLHDVGKIGVPDRVLHKPGPLDDDEWVLMRRHPIIGERILRHLPGLTGVARAVRHEHERWDGGGYPDGLAGEAIPLASRIVLACDAWHALVSDRPYRTALSPASARAELIRCAGTQFDPQVVEALLAALESPMAPSRAPGPETSADEEMRTLERELRALLVISTSVAGAHALDDVVEVTAEEALKALGADSLSICRWEAGGDTLRTLINVGQLGPGEERRPLNETYHLHEDDLLRRLLTEGRAYFGNVDDPDLFSLERELLEALDMRSCAAVPIMFGETAWGELWTARGHDKPDLGPLDLRFLQAIAGQIATAVGRAELFTRMADFALKDELTGVANRRALDERLELAFERAGGSGGDVALVLCDLDRLKDLNDALGHAAGDAALRRVADLLKELAAGHGTSMVARLGGDEICVLLEGCGATEARALAEEALTRLAGDAQPVGLSCGVATRGLGGDRPADLLRSADSALYLAKRSGRGRICLAADDPRGAWRAAGSQRQGRRGLRDVADTAAGSGGAIKTRVDGVDAAGLLVKVLNVLDGPLAPAGAAERLEAVMTACAAAVDGTAAALSVRAPGSSDLLTLIAFDRRSGHISRIGDGDDEERYAAADYPATEALMAGGGSAVWRADDPNGDPGEQALLAEWNMTAVLATAGSDDEGGGWLLEIFADASTAGLETLEPVARVLTVHALHGGVPAARSRSRAISAAARADTFA